MGWNERALDMIWKIYDEVLLPVTYAYNVLEFKLLTGNIPLLLIEFHENRIESREKGGNYD